MAEDPQSWAAQRRRAADHHAEAARRQAASDTAKAQAMVEAFVATAIQTLPTRRLRARTFGGGTRSYRTDRHGWYLRRDHSIGVGVDATYLVLTVPGSLLGLLRGVSVPGADPPLVVGRGGSDGVAIDLRDLLAQRLEAGPDF